MEMDCSSENVVGPFLENTPDTNPDLTNIIELSVDDAGMSYSVAVSKSDGWKAQIQIEKCGACELEAKYVMQPDETQVEQFIDLTEGNYELMIIYYSEGEDDVRENLGRWIDFSFNGVSITTP